MSDVNSLYGGKQNFSFIISKYYSTIKNMNDDFNNPNCTVRIGEYVLISNVNKYTNEHGRLYRRDINGKAEYLGNIAGPPGTASHIAVTSLKDIGAKIEDIGISEEDASLLITEGSWSPTSKDETFVPGKDDNNVYHDEIKWKTVSYKTADNEDVVAYIGFQMPYLVNHFDVRVDKDEPFDFKRVDDKTHPFYNEWQLTLPDGTAPDVLFVGPTADINDELGKINNGGIIYKLNTTGQVWEIYQKISATEYQKHLIETRAIVVEDDNKTLQEKLSEIDKSIVDINNEVGLSGNTDGDSLSERVEKTETDIHNHLNYFISKIEQVNGRYQVIISDSSLVSNKPASAATE